MFINNSWDTFLKIDKKIKDYLWLSDMFHFIDEIYRFDDEITKTAPKKEDVFKMYQLLDPNDIKVVFLFQDPYPQLKNGKVVATGIGLGAEMETASLKNFKKVITNGDKEKAEKINNTLMPYINQGIFSTNVYLTVRRLPLSHSEFNATFNNRPLRYDFFTKMVLLELNKHFKHICYVFFGKVASSFSICIDEKNNLIITTSHPSNRGCKYGLLESNFAEKINNYLKINNKKEIIW